MTRKDVTYRLTLPSCLSSLENPCYRIVNFSLFLPFLIFSRLSLPLSFYLYIKSKSIKGPSGDFFCNCFRSTGIGRGKKKRKTTYRSVRQSRSHSPCLLIMAASTSWRLAGSKYFNPRSRGSVTQWRHVLMGLVGLATEVYIYIGRAEARCPRTYPVRMWLANTRRGGISGKHREHLYIIPIFIDICYGTYGTRHASSDKISLLSRRWLPR